jgi:hypothetical protein
LLDWQANKGTDKQDAALRQYQSWGYHVVEHKNGTLTVDMARSLSFEILALVAFMLSICFFIAMRVR